MRRPSLLEFILCVLIIGLAFGIMLQLLYFDVPYDNEPKSEVSPDYYGYKFADKDVAHIIQYDELIHD